MKSKGLTLIAVTVLLLAGVLLLGAPTAQAGIFNDDSEVTYKEYWVNHSQFSGGCNLDGTPQDTNGSWYVEPGALNKCPKTLSFSIPDNISNAAKIEIYLDLWRNYDSQAARFRLNNQATVYAPPVGSDWSRTPYVVEVNKNEVFQGPNNITLWGDKSFHVHDIGIRVYYDDAHPITPGTGGDTEAPTGYLTGITDGDGNTYGPDEVGKVLLVNTNKITLHATVDDTAAYVEFHAYYDGYDEDNDGNNIDWHNLGRNNWWPGGKPAPAASIPSGTIDHIGTVKVSAPGSVDMVWDLKNIVNQSGVRFKIRVVDAAGNVRDAAGGASEAFTLGRNYPVFYYTIPGFTDFGLHMDGNRPDTVSYKFTLPDSIELNKVHSVNVLGAYWKKPKFSINGSPAQGANVGTVDEWDLGVAEYKYQLSPGENTITYSYSASGSGHFIEEPGPMFVFSYDNGPTDVIPPYIISRVPAPNTTGIDVRAPIVVHVGDEGAGVDPDSIVMFVNGQQVTPTVTGSALDRIVSYTPTTALPNDSVIPVTIGGCDFLKNCLINADSFSFTTESPDVVPPVISNVLVDATHNTAKITWVTNEPADSKVDYGLTTGYEAGAMSAAAPVTSHTLDLTGLTPETNYNFKVSSVDQDGNPASTANLTFKTKKVPGAVLSDDFSSCTLNDGIWTYINPLGDAAFIKNGQTLSIVIPGAVAHDIWKTGINAPRAMQTVTNQDFTIVVKMESTMNKKTQMQGILVQQDDNNYLRFNLQHDGAVPSMAIVDGNNGNALLTFSTPLPAVPSYMRVVRQLNTWTLDYSYDGDTWSNATTIPSKILTISKVGVFGGNTGNNPSHTATFDYFFNSASPIVPEDPAKTLTVNVEGVGSVVKNPDKTSYNCNDNVELTAVPVQDWTFVGWSGALTGSNPVENLSISDSSVVTATFENNSVYTLDVNTAFVGGINGGNIEVEPLQADYSYNDEVDLLATPELGWSFTGWSGSLTSVSPSETYVITTNSVITGTFTRDQYTLNLGLFNEGVGVGGTVTQTPNAPTYEYGDEVVLDVISVTPGWEFIGWEGDVASTDQSVMVTMTGSKTVLAHFRQKQQAFETNIISNAAPGGTGPGGAILRDPDKVSYGYGETVTLTASAFGGWTFDGWSGDLAGTNPTEQLVFTDDMSVTATFSQETYQLDVTSTGPGEVTVVPDKSEYFFGDMVTLTAVPESDQYDFDGWSGDLVGTGNPAIVTIEKDTTISAAFVLDTTPIEILSYKVEVFPNGKAARVIWTTDVPGTSQVEYGLTPFYDQLLSDGVLKKNHVMTLQGLQPETLYHTQITSLDQFGNPAITNDITFSTRATTGIISDDFALCGGLNPTVWQWIDPLGDSSHETNGTTVALTIPGGTEHNVYINGNNSARIMELADDKDFVIQVKFDSSLEDNGSMQGVIVEQDEENFIRFDFYKRNEQIVVYSAAFRDLTPVYANNKVKIADVAGPLYMRITRVGDTWMQEYSFDGTDWVSTTNNPFTFAMNVQEVGPFAGSFVIGGIVPAHTAVIDYFFNMAAPIEPEDSPYAINTSVVGQGTVSKDPEKQGYYCGEEVELQATPASGWVFAGWNGDISGTLATRKITVEGNLAARAIFFQQGNSAFKIHLPMSIAP